MWLILDVQGVVVDPMAENEDAAGSSYSSSLPQSCIHHPKKRVRLDQGCGVGRQGVDHATKETHTAKGAW